MKGFLEYVPGNSFLHKMNPVAKLVAAFILVIACFVTSNLALLAAIIVLDALLAVQCEMVPQTLGLAKAVAVFSILLAVIALLFTPQGDVLAPLPAGLYPEPKAFLPRCSSWYVWSPAPCRCSWCSTSPR